MKKMVYQITHTDIYTINQKKKSSQISQKKDTKNKTPRKHLALHYLSIYSLLHVLV